MRRLILVAVIAILLFIPSVVSADDTKVYGTEYTPEDDATIYCQVLDGAGSPVNDATVTLSLYDTDGNLEIDGESMSYIATTQGIYKYDFTAPADEGVYVAEVITANPTGYGVGEVHVTEAAGGGGITASDVWEEATAGYTDTSTFGGLINDILGGGSMLFVLGMLALGLIIAFFIWKSGVLAYGASGSFFLLGITAMGQSAGANPTEIVDAYMGLFWLCVAFTIACALLPAIMREKPSKDDIYVDEVDEVTGEKVKKEETKERKRRPRGGRLFDRSGKL